jgi:hypothetical protein
MKKAVSMGERKIRRIKSGMLTACSVLAASSFVSTTTVFAATPANHHTNHPVNYENEATAAVQGLIGTYGTALVISLKIHRVEAAQGITGRKPMRSMPLQMLIWLRIRRLINPTSRSLSLV